MLRGCLEEMRGVAAGRQNNLIILCPLFWLLQEQASSAKCPQVKRNTLTPNDDTLAVHQQGVLVHELAHVYGVYTTLRWQDGDHEQYNIRNASNLTPADALLTAPNYAFYYSGKYSFYENLSSHYLATSLMRSVATAIISLSNGVPN